MNSSTMFWKKPKARIRSSMRECHDTNEIEVELETTETDVDDLNKKMNCPTIVNNTAYPIVVFLERGILYNEQILYPGEAVRMTQKQTRGGKLKVPYKVHAILGDERALPSKTDSIKNILKISAVPAAFAAGCLLTAATAGTLSGPSAALAPIVSGLVVKGVVIDAAAIAAGATAANGTKKISEVLLKDHKETLVGVTSILKPRERYLSVTGGLLDGPVVIQEIPRNEFDRMAVETIKVPMKVTTIEMREEGKDGFIENAINTQQQSQIQERRG